MASFDPLAPIDPWILRSTDPWYPDAFAKETESALTKALQQSFFTQPISPSLFLNQTDYFTNTPSASTVTGSVSASGSEPETPGSTRTRTGPNLGVSPIGKTKKRKSRASKRSMTTFIQADPANFRQMVQQVTGVQFVNGNGNGNLPVRPEPVRQPYGSKLQGMLPTLDTSAYLLDVQKRIPATVNNGFSGMGQGAVNGGDFYSLCNFPTLESSI